MFNFEDDALKFICFCLAASLICITTYFIYNSYEVAKQTTCYGKVLQSSWEADGSQILALQACDGK